MLNKGDYVINKNELRVKKHQLTGDKYVATTDIYLIQDIDCDRYGQIEILDVNTDQTVYCNNKDCLVKVWR